MYGGLWTENAVQATARDIMAAAMLALERAGYPVILTVHDEVLAEVVSEISPVSYDALERAEARFRKIMMTPPAWAEGCPIDVECWHGERYRK